jgi:hypothetical protein
MGLLPRLKEDRPPGWLVDAEAASGWSSPEWATWVWSRPLRRFWLAAAVAGAAAWALVKGVRNPDEFYTDWLAGPAFVAAPFMLASMGPTMVQALWDAARGKNRRPFFMVFWHWLGVSPYGRLVALAALVMTIVWMRSLW